jgi:hypothetical protein
MHHIFFPPRLEVMVQQQNPYGFPSDARDEFALHGFLRDEAHCPSRSTFGRIAADHGDDALSFRVRQ